MDCSKNFHSSLDFVNSASKHYVVQHCTAGVCKQIALYSHMSVSRTSLYLEAFQQLKL